ncbi:hypothetical protein OSTOST_09554, partial [Ostertagia ostertagi]
LKTHRERLAIQKQRKEIPHLWNLNEDPALTDVIVHFLPPGEVTIGNKTAVPAPMVQLNGLSILPQHAVVVNSKNKKVTITPCGKRNPYQRKSIRRNTKGTGTKMQYKNRQEEHLVLFGGNHLYVFNNPTKGGARKDITYEEAQKELAQGAGIKISNEDGKSKADMILEEELISMMPLVYRANAMAVELKRNVKFELVLVSPEMRGLHEGLTEIWVNVHNLTEDTRFMWEKARFMNRYYGMQEMYENKIDGEDWNMPKLVLVSPEMRGLHEGLTEIWVNVHNLTEDTRFMWEKARFMNRYYGMQEMYENKIDGEDWNMPKERDPFYEAPDSKTFLGSAIVFLQPLAYLMDSEENEMNLANSLYFYHHATHQEKSYSANMLMIRNKSYGFQGLLITCIFIYLVAIEDIPSKIGKSYGFMVKIQSARGLPRRIEKSSCKYSFFNGKEINTQMLSGNSPSYAHEQIFQYKVISPELADYLLNSNLCISLWGTQKARQLSVSSNQSSRRRQSMTEPGEKTRPRKKRPSSQAPKIQRDENEAPRSGTEEKNEKTKEETFVEKPKTEEESVTIRKMKHL